MNWIPDNAEEPALTRDAFLKGRLLLDQPARGHRAGTDAMLLIAAAGTGERLVDLGAGPGPIGLGALALGRFRFATLVEVDPVIARIARGNSALNGLAGRVVVAEADVAARPAVLARAGLEAGLADVVMMNPPYNEPGRHRPSPLAARVQAHAMTADDADLWVKAAARYLTGSGRLVMIHRPEALPWLLPLLAKRFGDIAILPVHPRADQLAGRVLLAGRLNSKAPARMRPALVLHTPEGGFTELARSIHDGEAQLSMW